jgi:hypothetical protein
MTMKTIETMDRYEILDALLEDGFELESSADASDVSRELQRAARGGTLVWTREHIVDTRSGRRIVEARRVVRVEG